MRSPPCDDWPEVACSLARWFILGLFYFVWLTGCTLTLTNTTNVAAEAFDHRRELVNGSVTLTLEVPRETTKED